MAKGWGSKAGKLARSRGWEVRRRNQLKHVAKVFRTIEEKRQAGWGWRRIAAHLNLGGVGARRGGSWGPKQVERAFKAGIAARSLEIPLPGME